MHQNTSINVMSVIFRKQKRNLECIQELFMRTENINAMNIMSNQHTRSTPKLIAKSNCNEYDFQE